MEDIHLTFDQVNGFSKRDIALQLANKELRPFYKYNVDIDQFGTVIKDKRNDVIDRKLLVKVLLDQYNIESTDKLVKANIDSLLLDRTFTLCTAHQPSFLTGPLYFIYKIFSAINLGEELKVAYPDFNFVPIYIIGGEDHDFDEVNHVHLFGETYRWDSQQKGAVGRMDIENMKDVLADVYNVLGDSDNAMNLISIINNAFEQSSSYTEFTMSIVKSLFNKYGLVCLSMDDNQLKQLMIPVFKKEILQGFSQKLVIENQSELIKLGYKAQVHARDINIFYLHDGNRARIVEENGSFTVWKTDIIFTKEELLDELDTFPERFSPNVILRPLYQEIVLPNIAYVGGGGELAYWMELTKVFDEVKVNFPMLVRRDSVMLLDRTSQKLIAKNELKPIDLFEDLETLINATINSEIDISLKKEYAMLDSLFDKILNIVETIDPNLKGLVASTKVKQTKSLDNIVAKLRKTVKDREKVKIGQLDKLWKRVYPSGNLQERYDNFIPLYLTYGDDFFSMLKSKLNPLDKRFKVIVMK